MDFLCVQFQFTTKQLGLAIKHIQSKGANLLRFNIFKGNKPL